MSPFSDTDFYQDARMEQHVDESARLRLAKHHMRVLKHCTPLNQSPNKQSPKILDICSSFESHFPSSEGAQWRDCFGVGLNDDELAANPALNLG